jgi:hypothetical protein
VLSGYKLCVNSTLKFSSDFCIFLGSNLSNFSVLLLWYIHYNPVSWSWNQYSCNKWSRKRIFLPRWEKEFTWLKNTEKGMVCVICNTHWIIYYRSIDFMIRKLDCSVYIITTEQKGICAFCFPSHICAVPRLFLFF